MRRDLGLADRAARERLPEVVVESLDFRRSVNGREWRVRAAEADSESGVISARSIDIDVYETATKRNSRVWAKRGEFAGEHSKVWLWDVDGFVFLGDRSVDFAAPRADYDTSADVWFFGEGVSASDDKFSVWGGTGTICPSGTLNLGKGARIHWKTE